MQKLITFIFLLVTFAAFSQKQRQARMDSLLARLPQLKEDSQKLKLYIDIISTYNEFNQTEALPYEQPALSIASKLKSRSGEADVKNAIGRVYWRQGLFDKALEYHNEAKHIFEELKDKSKIALSTRYIGQDHADGANYPAALKNLAMSLEMYTQMGDRKQMAYIHSLFQWVHGKQGDYAAAFQSAYTALKLCEQIDDKNRMAIIMSDLAENYVYMGNYEDALRYFKKGTEVYRMEGDSTNVAYNYNLIGMAYHRMGNYVQSMKYHMTALARGKDNNDATIIGQAYDGIGEIYKSRHDYDKAITNFQAAAEKYERWKNKRELSRIYCKIGECYRVTNNYDLAKKSFEDAFALARELRSKTLISDYYQGMERLDSATGNWQGAYINHKRYVAVHDTIFSQKNITKMAQLDLMHEFDKKEAAAKAEQERKNFEQRIESISLGIISILILILALVFYRNQKRIANFNRELKHKSESLEEENREKTSILNIVSHDLKAPFNKIKGLTDLLSIPGQSREQLDEYIAHIRGSVDQGTYLIRNLLEAHNVGNGSNNPMVESIDLLSFISNFQVDANGQLLKKEQTLHINIETETSSLVTDKQMLTRVLDNLLSNASKFSERGKPIYLRVWSERERICFSVRDEGPGISEMDQKNMYKKFQILTARPTSGEGSTGLGLSITKALVDKLGGAIQLKSTLGDGTEFIVSLPM